MADQQQQQQQQQQPPQQQPQQQAQQQPPQQQQQRASAASTGATGTASQASTSTTIAMPTVAGMRSSIPQVQVIPQSMHGSPYMQPFAYNQHQQQYLLQNAAAVQAAMQANALNQMSMAAAIQGRPPSVSPTSPGLLSPPSNNSVVRLPWSADNLIAVSSAPCTVTTSASSAKNSNGSKGQTQQAAMAGSKQQQQPTIMSAPAPSPLVIGPIGMIPGQPNQAFVTQAKGGQTVAVGHQGQSGMVTSQASGGLRLSQPQLVTNQGQLLTSQAMPLNQAVLQAMASLGQLPLHQPLLASHPQPLSHLLSSLQASQMHLGHHHQQQQQQQQQQQPGQNPQLISLGFDNEIPKRELNPYPMLVSPAIMGQSLYIRPLQQGMVPGGVQGLGGLKPAPPQAKSLELGSTLKSGSGTTKSSGSKTILPSTSKTLSSGTVVKIHPNVVAAAPGSAPKLNIPVVPKQKSRSKTQKSAASSSLQTSSSSSSSSTSTAATSAATASPAASTAAVTAVSSAVKVASVASSKPAVSSNSKPATPTPAPARPPCATPPPVKSQSDSEVETGKKTATPAEVAEAKEKSQATAAADSTGQSSPAPAPAPPVSAAPPAPPTSTTTSTSTPSPSTTTQPLPDSNHSATEVMDTSSPLASPPLPSSQPKPLDVGVNSIGERQRAIVKPNIITHVIEGFIIQEGPEPFPVQQSTLLTEFIPPKSVQPEKESDEDPYDLANDQPPPLLPQSEAHAGETNGPAKCQFCGKTTPSGKFRRRSSRFCTLACAKRYNVACTNRVGLFKGPGKYVRKKAAQLGTRKGWRAGKGGRLAYNINMRAPVEEMSSSNSGQESSSSLSPLPPPSMDVDLDTPAPNPAKWTVGDVYEFVKSLPGCEMYAEEFRSQEIDGQALLLLKEDHLMTAMNIKLGPALKICARIASLKSDI